MRRLRWIICTASLAAFVPGCGDGMDSPAAPQPDVATTPDFTKKTGDMMKEANAGMDLKKAQAASMPRRKNKNGLVGWRDERPGAAS